MCSFLSRPLANIYFYSHTHRINKRKLVHSDWCWACLFPVEHAGTSIIDAGTTFSFASEGVSCRHCMRTGSNFAAEALQCY